MQFWPEFKGRDGCRTPMPWVTDNTNGGFSDKKPWLPMAAEHLHRSVGEQIDQTDSLLAFYKRAIAYRTARKALVQGSADIVSASDTSLVMIRTFENQRVLCAFNFSDASVELTLPTGEWQNDALAPFASEIVNGRLQLEAYSAGFARDAA